MNDVEFSKTLKDLNIQIFKVINKRHKELGIDITPIQGTIIRAIYENKEALCQKNLEAFVSCNKSTLSSILDTMKKKDLIERKNDNQDTRKKNIVLTKKSKNLITMLEEDRNLLEKRLFQGIGEEELKIFNITLNKIVKNLERM